ncbi:hypothetical protein L593_05790 [Salinarchaeum sp. Harcht-Bsk1]|nr:hypothetical protein L593_05790 [Salinarchaeum sp. Harcht-Bsk1]
MATDVYVEPERVYDLLVSFTEYAQYSEYLDEVTRHGDGSPGTEYELSFSWWRLAHTTRSRVTDVDPPNVINWRLVSRIAAQGRWEIEEAAEPIHGTASTGDPVTRVRFVVEYDPESADGDVLGLPALLSFDGLVDRVTPLIEDEATRVVERVVADLEGEPRDVELEVRHSTD